MSKLLRFNLRLASAFTFSLSLHGSAIQASNFSNNATIVNFDDLSGGNCNLCGPSVANQYAPRGVTFSNPGFPGQDTADTNLAALISNSTTPNTLYVFQGGLLGDAPALPFNILFSVPVTSVGFYYGSSIGAYLELDAYGGNHQLLDTLTFEGSPAPIGLAGFAGVQESIPIVELDASYHPYSDISRTLNFSIDNLEFQGSSVPEPSTLALIVTGFLVTAGCRVTTRRQWCRRFFSRARPPERGIFYPTR